MRRRRLPPALPLALSLGACQAWEHAPAPPVQSTVFQGRVVGPEGVFVHAAEISLYVAEAGSKWTQVDLVRTSSNGTYTVRTPRAGHHRIAANAPGCIEADSEIEVPPGVGTQLCD